MIEPIDINKIKTTTTLTVTGGGSYEREDPTMTPIKLLANKINELVEVVNKLKVTGIAEVGDCYGITSNNVANLTTNHTNTNKESWEVEFDTKVNSAKWAFLAYGRIEGFKNHIQFAEEEVGKLKQFIKTQRTQAKEEERKRIEEGIKARMTEVNREANRGRIFSTEHKEKLSKSKLNNKNAVK